MCLSGSWRHDLVAYVWSLDLSSLDLHPCSGFTWLTKMLWSIMPSAMMSLPCNQLTTTKTMCKLNFLSLKLSMLCVVSQQQENWLTENLFQKQNYCHDYTLSYDLEGFLNCLWKEFRNLWKYEQRSHRML